MISFLTTIIAATPTPINLGNEFGSRWGQSGANGLGLNDLVSLILQGGITLGGIIVLFTFIFGGLSVIRGAGNNDPKAAAQGQQALTYALIGFIIVFTAFWGIRLVEIITGDNFLTAP